MEDSQATQVEGSSARPGLFAFFTPAYSQNITEEGREPSGEVGAQQCESFQTLLWAQGWVGVPST